MSGRCLLLSKRNPDTILTSIIAPILTMLLFAYVIGGAMQTGETSYVNFIVPGIILQCPDSKATTAIAVCSDIKSGIMERFCTMPVKRSSILNGHVREAFIRNMVTALLILLVAFLIGFRPEVDLLGWCARIADYFFVHFSHLILDIRIFRNDCEQSGGQAHSQFWRSLCPASAPVSYQSTPCRKHCRIFAEYQPITLSLIPACLLPE